MTDKKGKTIKQIAEELGVSKQAVHQKRKSKELSTALQSFTSTIDGVVYISVDGEKLIKSAFWENDRKRECKQVDGSFTPSFTPKSSSETDVFMILQEQIKEKDKQLAEKDKQLAEKDKQIGQLQSLLDQEQKLHAATSQRLLLLEEKKENEEPGSARWWQFWK